jgi:hypothetical protein
MPSVVLKEQPSQFTVSTLRRLPIQDLPAPWSSYIGNAVVIVALFVQEASVLNVHLGSIDFGLVIEWFNLKIFDFEGQDLGLGLQTQNIHTPRGELLSE